MIRPKSKNTLLLYGDSEKNADVLYFSKVFIPDAFIAMSIGSKKIAVLGQLEYGRVIKTNVFDKILSLDDYQVSAKKIYKVDKVETQHVIGLLVKEYKIGEFTVSEDFPLRLALELEKLGVRLKVSEGQMFQKREVKERWEAKAIQDGNAASAAGLHAAETALKKAKIKGNKLILNGKALTSERLRSLVDIACLEKGSIAQNTIVAGGNQACDPHCRGEGILRPNELIIVDVFPRVSKTGYHGDMTRTFLKGKASEKQKKLVKAVQEAQKVAFSAIKAGVPGRGIHRKVQEFLKKKGFETKKVGQRYIGFFHGTGHGLGLEVHEAPRMGVSGSILKAGTVVTVEPGLYYPGLGGCRIEDVVWVQKGGYNMLSKYHYTWQLS